MVKKLAAEAIGTFFLVFTVGQTILPPNAGDFAPFAIGFVLAIMIYATGHVSGGHLNPAVTLGVYIRGKATLAELGGYWVAQVVGAIIAAFVVLFLKPDVAPPTGQLPVVPVLLAEFLFTFALVFVVLNVATARGTEGNSFFGFAIGGTVLVGAFAVGNISGAAFNPGVAVGAVVLQLIAFGDLWLYIVAQLAAGAAAAFVFNGFGFAQDKPITATPAEQEALRPAASTN